MIVLTNKNFVYDERRLPVLEWFMLQMRFAYGRGLLLNLNSFCVNFSYYDMKLGLIHLRVNDVI